MTPPTGRRITLEGLLFALLLSLHLMLIWAHPFIPTQDGPGHQAVAFVLRHYDDSEAGILRRYFLPNREALPNWFIFFLMSRVLEFISVPLAEKVLVTAYALLLPLAARYALRAVEPRSTFLAVLAFPFTFNHLFQMGFFNFCFSLPAFFFTVGYWLHKPERMGMLRMAALALLVLWVYFCHPVTLAVTVTVLWTLAGWRVFLDRRTGSRSFWASVARWLPAPAIASLPAVLLLATFVGRRAGAPISFLPLWVKVKHLAALYSLASVSRATVALAALLALLFYLLALRVVRDRARRPLAPADGLLLAAAVLAVAYFAAPTDLAGGGFINHRLNLFPFLVLILWFGSFDALREQQRIIQLAAASLSIAFLAVFFVRYGRMNEGLSAIAAAAEHMEPDRTFLFLSYAPQGEGAAGEPLAFRTRPFLHAGGYLAARKRLVNLSLYEANEDYFPILYRPAINPYRYLSVGPLGIEREPPRVEILAYPQRTGGRVDYVLLWGLGEERRREPGVREVLNQLALGFTEIWASPDGAVRLFRATAPPG